jgi:hypothetical protein
MEVDVYKQLQQQVGTLLMYLMISSQTQANHKKVVILIKILSMKVLLDIPDNKANAIMEVLNSIPYIKTKALTDEKATLVGEIRETVIEMKLIKAGKKKASNAAKYKGLFTDEEATKFDEYLNKAGKD